MALGCRAIISIDFEVYFFNTELLAKSSDAKYLISYDTTCFNENEVLVTIKFIIIISFLKFELRNG